MPTPTRWARWPRGWSPTCWPPTASRTSQTSRVEFLALQPRLDGTGGRFWGEAGPQAFAILEAATDPGPATAAALDGLGMPVDAERARELGREAGRRRLARLLDRLEHTCTPTHDTGGPATTGTDPPAPRGPAPDCGPTGTDPPLPF